MGSFWLFLVVGVAIFISMVLLAVVCLDCRVKGPPASISQATASDEYMPSNFRVIYPSQPTIAQGSIHSPSNLLSPFSHSGDTRTQRRTRSVTPTEPAPDYINNESDQEDPGYIIVLPSPSISQASTPSSDLQNDYVNVNENRDYLNVELLQKSTSDVSALSDSDDDSEGNYVNQPPMNHSQPSA